MIYTTSIIMHAYFTNQNNIHALLNIHQWCAEMKHTHKNTPVMKLRK